MKLGLEKLGRLAVCRGIGLAPLVHSQGKDCMRPARLVIQVMSSNSPVAVSCLQQLSNVCLCLDLNFPAALQHSKSKPESDLPG